jgi:hypothetical protein
VRGHLVDASPELTHLVRRVHRDRAREVARGDVRDGARHGRHAARHAAAGVEGERGRGREREQADQAEPEQGAPVGGLGLLRRPHEREAGLVPDGEPRDHDVRARYVERVDLVRTGGDASQVRGLDGGERRPVDAAARLQHRLDARLQRERVQERRTELVGGDQESDRPRSHHYWMRYRQVELSADQRRLGSAGLGELAQRVGRSEILRAGRAQLAARPEEEKPFRPHRGSLLVGHTLECSGIGVAAAESGLQQRGLGDGPGRRVERGTLLGQQGTDRQQCPLDVGLEPLAEIRGQGQGNGTEATGNRDKDEQGREEADPSREAQGVPRGVTTAPQSEPEAGKRSTAHPRLGRRRTIQ